MKNTLEKPCDFKPCYQPAAVAFLKRLFGISRAGARDVERPALKWMLKPLSWMLTPNQRQWQNAVTPCSVTLNKPDGSIGTTQRARANAASRALSVFIAWAAISLTSSETFVSHRSNHHQFNENRFTASLTSSITTCCRLQNREAIHRAPALDDHPKGIDYRSEQSYYLENCSDFTEADKESMEKHPLTRPSWGNESRPAPLG